VSWLIRVMSLRSVSFGPGVPLPFRGWIEPPVLCIVPHVVKNFGGAPEFPFLVHDADTVSQHQHHQQTCGQSTVPEEGVRGARVEKRLPPPLDHRSIIEVVLVDQLGRCREEIILLLVRARSCLALIKPRRRLLLFRFVRRA